VLRILLLLPPRRLLPLLQRLLLPYLRAKETDVERVAVVTDAERVVVVVSLLLVLAVLWCQAPRSAHGLHPRKRYLNCCATSTPLNNVLFVLLSVLLHGYCYYYQIFFPTSYNAFTPTYVFLLYYATVLLPLLFTQILLITTDYYSYFGLPLATTVLLLTNTHEELRCPFNCPYTQNAPTTHNVPTTHIVPTTHNVPTTHKCAAPEASPSMWWCVCAEG
jgi:hypothetical protein